MKKIFWLSFVSVFVLISCNPNDDIVNVESSIQMNLSSQINSKKVTICHYDEINDVWNSIIVSENSLSAHLEHGDVMGECSDTVFYGFDDCTLNGFTHLFGGLATTFDTGISGCGVLLDRPAGLLTDLSFTYGTYEMDTRASTSVSNQYFILFTDGLTYSGITLDMRPDGTDDEGIQIYINGTPQFVSGRNEMPISYPNWYHVKVEVTPDLVKVWLDNTLVFETYDYGGITIPVSQWYISSYSRSEFDNLMYTPIH